MNGTANAERLCCVLCVELFTLFKAVSRGPFGLGRRYMPFAVSACLILIAYTRLSISYANSAHTTHIGWWNWNANSHSPAIQIDNRICDARLVLQTIQHDHETAMQMMCSLSTFLYAGCGYMHFLLSHNMCFLSRILNYRMIA